MEWGDRPSSSAYLAIRGILALFKSLNLQKRIEAVDAVELLSNRSSVNGKVELPDEPKESRGRTWFEKLTNGARSISEVPSVLVADGEVEGISARFIAVVPNRANSYYRAQNGEVGLLEGWTIAKYVHQAIEEDSKSGTKRLIVPIVDVPSQAFGYHEELFGIYLSCSAAVDAYATARLNGHPIVTAIVGKAISGAFLSHGMQGNRLIALDDEEVQVHVMSKSRRHSSRCEQSRSWMRQRQMCLLWLMISTLSKSSEHYFHY